MARRGRYILRTSYYSRGRKRYRYHYWPKGPDFTRPLAKLMSPLVWVFILMILFG